jgi:hypothetical protein
LRNYARGEKQGSSLGCEDGSSVLENTFLVWSSAGDGAAGMGHGFLGDLLSIFNATVEGAEVVDRDPGFLYEVGLKVGWRAVDCDDGFPGLALVEEWPARTVVRLDIMKRMRTQRY